MFPPEFLAPDLMAFDDGDRVGRQVGARIAEEVRDVKDDKRKAHEREAPLEPVSVPAHPVEHCHGVNLLLSLFNDRGQLPGSPPPAES